MSERNDDICDVPGILVGHDTQAESGTGCTVVLCVHPAVGAVDVRGGAPGTRETDLLDPACMMQETHAVLLSGGSAFGLAAADGVMRILEERGVGFDTGLARVPIVPAAVLFDLGVGRADVRPDAASGRRAVEAATGGPVPQGSVGAGTGATVGKTAGPTNATKGGIGSASATLPDGRSIGALVAVNAAGDIYDVDSGGLLAGARNPTDEGWLAQSAPSATTAPTTAPFPGTNTTLAVVATDAPFSKAELTKLAQMAQDGLALAIRPSHTPFDGDTVFALSTAPAGMAGAVSNPLLLSIAGAIGAQLVARAISKAVRAATGLHGVPALRDLPFAQ